jgi:signal transduction histidine kinase
MRDFVAIASHDLRTPTASITGYASLLQRRWDILSEGDKLQAVDAMNRQSNHLHRLVEDLLTTSRIGASAIPVRPTTVNVADCLTDVVDDLQIAGVEIVASPDLFVVMDRDHLRRAITNYLRNAEVYGAPPLKIVAGREGNEITIKVVDHGNGVPEGFRPRLFEKFARADSKMSSAVGGTGLGLSIVTGLLEAAGGTAWYAPNVPRGSVFGITLPVPVAIPQQETREPQWTSAESS